MFDIGGIELFVIVVVAILVVGPRELPGLVRTIGRMVSQVRKMAGEFNRQMDQAVREVELEDVRDAARSVTSGANPVKQFENTIRGAMDGTDSAAKSGATVAEKAKASAAAATTTVVAASADLDDDDFDAPAVQPTANPEPTDQPERGGVIGAVQAAAARPEHTTPDVSGFDAADEAEHQAAAAMAAASDTGARPNGSVVDRADKSWKAATQDEPA